MFHAFDNTQAHQPGEPVPVVSRKDWMALLARAPLPLLEAGLAGHLDAPSQWLRPPQTGLMMVQGRAGATGERFNLGEVTVTRCTLRLVAASADRRGDGGVSASVSDVQVGTAYVLGRSHIQARLAALADALLQDAAHYTALERNLLEPLRQHLRHQSAARQTRADSTKVEFFTVARESGGAGDDEEDA
jgi:alpha-D-ribose 1-methylphosphonate 5-triphosphate synthase subunit PhnG